MGKYSIIRKIRLSGLELVPWSPDYRASTVLIESAKISDCDLGVYINDLDKLREDFKIRLGDLDNMRVPEWLVTPSDMKIYNKVMNLT